MRVRAGKLADTVFNKMQIVAYIYGKSHCGIISSRYAFISLTIFEQCSGCFVLISSSCGLFHWINRGRIENDGNETNDRAAGDREEMRKQREGGEGESVNKINE